jgi:chemotaxis signal transduction protein
VTDSAPAVAERAAELRRAFDRTFAEPPVGPREDFEALLGLRAGGERILVRLGEIRALLPEPTLVPLPSRAPGLLGIAGLRGAVVPVYGLGALLGQAPATERSPWILLVGAEAPLGLAFEELGAYLRAPRSQIFAAAGDACRPHVAEVARVGDVLCGIVDVRSVMRALEKRIGVRDAMKEI